MKSDLFNTYMLKGRACQPSLNQPTCGLTTALHRSAIGHRRKSNRLCNPRQSKSFGHHKSRGMRYSC